MAQNVNWEELLEKKYPSYKVEVEAFLDTAHISRSNDVSMNEIFSVIENDANVSDTLKMLYREAIFGMNKDVKSRIRNRIANFRRSLKGHPKIKAIDMLHAADYANMELPQMEAKLKESKEKDDKLSKGMNDEFERLKKKNADENYAAQEEIDVEKQGKKDDNFVSPGDFFKGNLQLEEGDFVYNDDNFDVEKVDEIQKMRTYNREKSADRKKLIPKSKEHKKQMPQMKQSKAEKEFDKVVKAAKDIEQDKGNAAKNTPQQIKELVTSFNTEGASHCSPQDEAIVEEIKKATQSMSENSVEQTAYFHALGSKNNLNMEKFRKEVQEELKDQENDGKKEICDSTGATGNIPPDTEDGESGTEEQNYSFEGDGLPNDNNDSVDCIFYGDDAETEAYSPESDDTQPDDSILYQNQEADPEVAALMFKEFLDNE